MERAFNDARAKFREDKMKKISFALSVLLILAVMSCRTGPTVTPNYDTWLEAQNMPSQMNVSGRWNAGESWGGGWGEANLIQQGRNVNGTLGLYTLKGVVSRKTMFVILTSGGYVYYTAKLDMKADGSLSGVAYREAIAGSPEAEKVESYPINMKRM